MATTWSELGSIYEVTMGTAVELSDELVAAAREESTAMSRSITQQVEHWARIGRLIERNPGWSYERVRQALAADVAYDDLSTPERLTYLAELEDELFAPDGEAALAKRFSR